MKRRAALALPMVLFVVTAAAMSYSYFSDAYYPYLAMPPDRRMGHNRAGVLASALSIAALELAIYLALIRPWKRRPPLGGLILAALLGIAWSAVSLLLTLDAGGVLFVHFFWVLGLDLLVLRACVVRVVESLRAARAGRR